MNKRLFYLDNLRVFLTMLVIVFHTSIAYGAAGSWYYEDVDKSRITVTMVLLTIFTAVCQSFFMGLFFFISGYFTPDAFDRKGILKFLKDRFLRLGIPLVIYLFVLGPTTIYLSRYRNEESYLHFCVEKILHFKILNFGPLWFVEALIYFSLLYSFFRLIAKKQKGAIKPILFPTNMMLMITALIFGLIAFFVRLIYPTGTGPLELQLGYFPLYILLFVAGIMSYRNNWLEQIPLKLKKKWLIIAIVFIPLLPIGLILTGALKGHIDFNGGFNLQAFMYAMWEPFVCFGICLGLLVLFQVRWNRTNKFIKILSNSAYTAYIIHPIIVVSCTQLFHNISLAPIIKFVIVAPMAVTICFTISYLIYKIPYANKIL